MHLYAYCAYMRGSRVKNKIKNRKDKNKKKKTVRMDYTTQVYKWLYSYVQGLPSPHPAIRFIHRVTDDIWCLLPFSSHFSHILDCL